MPTGLDTQKGNVGLALVVLGVILLLIVFYKGYQAFETYNLDVQVTNEDTATILNISAEVLVNLLVKIAFLGVSLAAGSVILKAGVNMMKECPKEGSGKVQ